MKRGLKTVMILCLAGILLGHTACAPQIQTSTTPTSENTVTEAPTEAPTATSEMNQKHHIIIMSDLHLCHLSWNGHTSEYRMDKMIKDLNDYNKENPYSDILFLGDYSLDFWQHGEKGSWINKGVSNTKNLIENYLSKLECQDFIMVPGNHEQYSDEKWKEITGNDRQTYTVIGGWLFILLDNFNKNLDPSNHSDGTYSGADVEYIKDIMAENPDMPVIIAAHHINKDKESDEFRELVANDERIVCLFSGHEHHNRNVRLGRRWGDKTLFYLGNYAYTKNVTVQQCMWGWRSLEFDNSGITIEYYSPQSTITVDGASYTNEAGVVSSMYLDNPLKKG